MRDKQWSWRGQLFIAMKQKWRWFEQYAEDVPIVLVRDGAVSVIPKR